MRVAHRAALSPPSPTSDGGDSAAPAYDPGAHTVADVLAYVTAHPEQVNAVYGAELAGKARTTLLDKLAVL